eukprot:scaffold469525_cov14-Prasinocladus_malaysianus.AAC.1
MSLLGAVVMAWLLGYLAPDFGFSTSISKDNQLRVWEVCAFAIEFLTQRTVEQLAVLCSYNTLTYRSNPHQPCIFACP